ncbi:MAG: helicase-related protein [Bacteriovoracaceae bacterium]
MRQDPKLKEYSAIILDEFHERSIHTDVALALIRKLQATSRPDLKLIVMSATLETEKLESYLQGPKVFDIPGRTFPIDIEYRPPEISRRNSASSGHGNLRSEAVQEAIQNLLDDSRCPLNVLVFLPGVGEIKGLEEQLKGKFDPSIEIAPLYSSLPKALQNKAFEGDRRKIILATNIAETSLTIPNITGVIDTGTERRASFAPWSGMPLLQLEKISKASSAQRAGRAGRTQHGVVYRLYSEADFAQREDFTPPEIKRVELSHYILDLLELGHHPDDLNWFEPPDEKNLKTALNLLEILGAIKDGEITKLGSFLAELPLHPRLGATLFNCPKQSLSDALLAACVLSEGMILGNRAHFSDEDKEVCDLSLQLDLLKSFYWKNPKLSDYPDIFLEKKKAARALELYQALASRIHASAKPQKHKTKPQELAP